MSWLNPLCILHFFPTDCHRSFLTLLSRDHAMVTWGVDDVGWKIDFLRQTLPFAASCAAGPSESGEELHGCFFLKKIFKIYSKVSLFKRFFWDLPTGKRAETPLFAWWMVRQSTASNCEGGAFWSAWSSDDLLWVHLCESSSAQFFDMLHSKHAEDGHCGLF